MDAVKRERLWFVANQEGACCKLEAILIGYTCFLPITIVSCDTKSFSDIE